MSKLLKACKEVKCEMIKRGLYNDAAAVRDFEALLLKERDKGLKQELKERLTGLTYSYDNSEIYIALIDYASKLDINK